MTTITRTTTPTRQPVTPLRKTALAAGVLYLLTFVTSIPALGLYDDVLNNPDFVLGAGSDSAVLWAAFLELFAGLTCVGTVVLYRVIRRDRESAAMGFVAARTLEAGMIFVGALSLLSTVTLCQDVTGTASADAASLVTTARSLVALRWPAAQGGHVDGIDDKLGSERCGLEQLEHVVDQTSRHFVAPVTDL